MSTKKHELEMAARGEGCLGKAADNEPVFILRGQDKLAPALVVAWARLAAEHGCGMGKVKEALDLAHSMASWSTRKFPD